MRFAVLTQQREAFDTIAHCFAPDGVVCQHFRSSQLLLGAQQASPFTLLLVDAASFEQSRGELLAWYAGRPERARQLIVYGKFADRESMFRAFEAGVGDVLVGAIEPNEMYVRIQRVLRSPAEPAQSYLAVGPYRLQREPRSLSWDGRAVALSEREFAMLWLFFSAPGTFFSKQRLATLVSGAGQECSERTVEQHIYKLRKKLGFGCDGAVQLRAIHALGYAIEVAAPGRTDAGRQARVVQTFARRASEQGVCVR